MTVNIKPASQTLDLSKAVVQTLLPLSRLAQKAAQILIEEVEKRTRLRWAITQETTAGQVPVIILGQVGAGETPRLADRFQIRTLLDQPAPQIQILGNNARGVLFGVGYL